VLNEWTIGLNHTKRAAERQRRSRRAGSKTVNHKSIGRLVNHDFEKTMIPKIPADKQLYVLQIISILTCDRILPDETA
jgi:hypothetical protein